VIDPKKEESGSGYLEMKNNASRGICQLKESVTSESREASGQWKHKGSSTKEF